MDSRSAAHAMHGGGRWRASVLVAAMASMPVTAAAAPFPDPGVGTASGLDALADAVLRPGIAAAGSPRVVLGLSLHGQRRYRTYGGDGQASLEPGSIVEIGSITKVFTTALLAEAIDAGTVDPDLSIGAYLPGVPLRPCTARTFQRAMRPIYQPPGRFFSVGLAWASAPDGSGGTMIYKDGGTDGFTTILVVDPDRDCTVFLAADRAGIDLQRLGLTLMRAIHLAAVRP